MSTAEGGGADYLDDRQQLHKLGYAQELYRSMGGFQNFAISFTIISILAGCLTSYYIAFNQGGPVAVTWGWLLVGAFCIIVSLAMGEIASTYPDSGRPLLLGVEARQPGVGLVHRLVQPHRADRRHGRDRLRLRGLHDVTAEPALRLPEHHPLGPLHVRLDPGRRGDREHVQGADHRRCERVLGLVAHDRRARHRRRPDRRPRQPQVGRIRVRRDR